MSNNLFNNFFTKLHKFGDTQYLIQNNTFLTYNELLIQIEEKLSIIKKSGLKAGDNLAIYDDFNTNSISTFLAAIKAQITVIPILKSDKENNNINENNKLAQCGSYYYFSEDYSDINFQYLEKENNFLKEIGNNENAHIIIFSSGSTGTPKGVVHKADGLLNENLTNKTHCLKTLQFLVFDHIGGINTFLNTLFSGGTLCVPPSKKPDEIVDFIEHFGVNLLPTTPSFLNLLLVSKALKSKELKSLKAISYGTEPMTESTLKRLKDVLPNVKFIQTFGTTETGILHLKSKSSTSTALKLDSSKYDHKIVKGILHIRSKRQAIGTLQNGKFENSWIATGDEIKTIENGFIEILGNKKTLINVGGKKVYAVEVENEVLKLPFINDCLVYAEPNRLLGEIVACDLVINKEYVGNPKRALKQKLSENLDSFKIPMKIYLVNAIKKTSSLKKARR